MHKNYLMDEIKEQGGVPTELSIMSEIPSTEFPVVLKSSIVENPVD